MSNQIDKDDELIKTHHKNDIKQLAENTMNYVEPICQECWDNGKDDPLGNISGVNTPANKKINNIAEQIIEDNNLDYMYKNDLVYDLMDIFYEERQKIFENKFNRKVEYKISCFYCFEDDKKSYRNNTDLEVRIGEDTYENHPLFGKDEKNWR